MGKVIPLLRGPRSWTDCEREVISRINCFYNRCNLVNNFAYVVEGLTEEGEPWIAYVRSDGDAILSITKSHRGTRLKFIIRYRSNVYEFDDLESFTSDFIAENLWVEKAFR
jgi:hypothetical protein